MLISDIQSFIEFIETTEMNCVYKLIILYSIIKLKDAEGKFDKEKLVNFFIEFFKIGKRYKLLLGQKCDPLQNGDREKTMQLINKYPINNLIKEGILKTSETFDSTIFEIIFNNENEILFSIKQQMIRYFVTPLGDLYLSLNLISEDGDFSFQGDFLDLSFLKELLEEFLVDWEKKINEIIKLDALSKLASCHEKINLEFLLKYLYQSYNSRLINKLVEKFQMTQEDLINFFISNIDDFSKFFVSEEIEPQIFVLNQKLTNTSQLPKSEITQEVTPSSERTESALALEPTPTSEVTEVESAPVPTKPPKDDRIRGLTYLWHQMREISLEDDYIKEKPEVRDKSKKEKHEKKKKKGLFRKLFRK